MLGRAAVASFASSIEQLDAELRRLSRSGGALRLGLGMGFEVLALQGGHHEMGFSSLEAYALERCERSARWVQESRSLARKVDELPIIRRALLSSELSWSMASVLASEATAEDECAWLAEASGRTVREMRKVVKERRRQNEGAQADSAKAACTDEQSALAAPDAAGDDEDFRVLTVTVDREDAWLFECARMIVRQVSGGRTEDEVVEALLAEGFSTLSRWLPKEAITDPDEDAENAAQRAWETQLARWREQAEVMCEGRVRGREDGSEKTRESDEPDSENFLDARLRFEGSIEQIDQALRSIASELTTRDVAIGQLAERFWKADGWRRLGYATESQYARERLGMSLSAVEAKRRLARKLERLPRLAAAIREREIGYEAARVVAQVATPETVDQWVERAAERTVRCLRDEVDAAEMIARVTAERAIDPPSEELMSELERVESEVVSGAVFARQADGQGQAESQMSAPGSETKTSPLSSTRHAARHAGRVTLRLRVRAGTRRLYRWLERLFMRYRRARVSFFHFLCGAFIETWKGSLGFDGAYAAVYARDRYRCTCPACRRTDVTPHHLEFRSRGGADIDENVSSLCTWCHLEGIHGGRLAAEPPASGIRWSIGRTVHTVVEGRRRVTARAGAVSPSSHR